MMGWAEEGWKNGCMFCKLGWGGAVKGQKGDKCVSHGMHSFCSIGQGMERKKKELVESQKKDKGLGRVDYIARSTNQIHAASPLFYKYIFARLQSRRKKGWME
jgi:hypothetical protein